MAIDENVDALKELAREVSYPVLVDADHHLTELYAISNVPTVVWVDEEDQIVRPNAAEFGTDTFTELTGIHCDCLLYTSPSPRDRSLSRMPSSA